MPCVEGDRSDCQPKVNSIAGSQIYKNGVFKLNFRVVLSCTKEGF